MNDRFRPKVVFRGVDFLAGSTAERGMRKDRRRQFLLASSALLAAPLSLFAQPQTPKVYRIGFLGISFASGYVHELDWIRTGLSKLGYVEGKNIVIEYRWAEGIPARLREITAEFVALKVDVILTHALPGAIAAAAETSTIPIVMADGGDPVAVGLAVSLSRPGRNVTGSFSFVLEEIGKRLELLKEILPRMKRVAFLASAADTVIANKRSALESAAASMKLETQEFMIREVADLPDTFNLIGKTRIDAVLVNNETLLNSQAGVIAALAAVKRMPSIGYPSYADVGGLLAYGANRPLQYTRAAHFLDQIFKGTKPGDIPFERATKFDLIVNRRTARTLSLAIPQSILLRADRVIE
jgi:putative ABC transport system substrate-binding protein